MAQISLCNSLGCPGTHFVDQAGLCLPSSGIKGACAIKTSFKNFKIGRQWTHLPRFEPSRDAVEMKSMITDSPRNSTLFRSSRRLVGLTFNAKIHNVVPADGTVINYNIPGPEGYRIPLFHFKALLARAAVGAAGGIHIHRCRHFENTLGLHLPFNQLGLWRDYPPLTIPLESTRVQFPAVHNHLQLHLQGLQQSSQELYDSVRFSRETVLAVLELTL
ncbi:hypothetical protein U0070_011571 [Myodes glareolus]|uniref:Uncharacterized protein n=1 Tax=Myodes glareolus TaxID=447135 RepID=A0AAW0HC68_MYOGA